MQIIVETNEEQRCLKVLLQNLKYAWDMCGSNTDSYYKAFEYVNDNPECWKDGNLVKDYKPILESILNNIDKTEVKVR